MRLFLNLTKFFSSANSEVLLILLIKMALCATKRYIMLLPGMWRTAGSAAPEELFFNLAITHKKLFYLCREIC